MSNSITVFSFLSDKIRFINGLPVAIDVARALGYLDVSNTISRKVDADYKQLGKLSTQEKEELGIRNDEIITLLEPGIYQLIFSSKLPSAKAFQQWVFEEVLPSIRKTGKYETQTTVSIYAKRLDIATQWAIPKGHWCIFHEISLLANKVGIEYPVAEYDLIDGSVGQAWNKYRTAFDWCKDTTTFPVFFGDNRDKADVQAKAYRNSELSYFRDWLDNVYTYGRLPKYLNGKYGKLMSGQMALPLD
jgi:prophage antirepressor-like protein